MSQKRQAGKTKESLIEKAERLYIRFGNDLGIDAANTAVVDAAVRWHDIHSTHGDNATLKARALATVTLCEAIEKVQDIRHRAGTAASHWAQTDEKPK